MLWPWQKRAKHYLNEAFREQAAFERTHRSALEPPDPPAHGIWLKVSYSPDQFQRAMYQRAVRRYVAEGRRPPRRFLGET